MGAYITEALVKTGIHHVTAITRPDSKNKMPSGVIVKRSEYDDAAALTEALRGQDVLIITMNVMAPKDSQTKLIDAAAAAGVPWILPNQWGSVDPTHALLRKESLIGEGARAVREYIESKGVSSWIDVTCGFWYEFSLSGAPVRYGFDFQNKEVTFFDDGNTKIHHSTWPQVGRAVASLLSLPIKSEGGGACLEHLRNKHLYISSYCASRKEIFDSVLRVTGESEKDWKISHEDVQREIPKGCRNHAHRRLERLRSSFVL
jgi:NmrA-like family